MNSITRFAYAAGLAATLLFALRAHSTDSLISPSPVSPDTAAQTEGQSSSAQPIYVQVTQGPTPVRLYLSPDAPMIGMAKRGDILTVVGKGQMWHMVRFGDTIGWIEARTTALWEKNQLSSFSRRLPAYILLAFIVGGVVLVCVAVIVVVISITSAKKSKGPSVKIPEGRNCLILASKPIPVRSSLDDSQKTLEQYFGEIGFAVRTATEFSIARSILMHYLPDIICVDCRLDGNAVAKMKEMLSGKAADSVSVVFLNVLDPGSFSGENAIPNSCFLGSSFTDRELFRVVTPVALSPTQRMKVINKSAENHALEGEVGIGSLSDVFQFIEMGQKSGCLLIEQEKPFGMIFFDRGTIIYAAISGNVVGVPAVNTILSLSQGRFRFLVDKLPPTRNMNAGALQLLMEWARVNDEAARS